MSLKDKFKKLSMKVRLVIGAIAVIVAAGSGYWTLVKVGYERNVFIYDKKFDRVVFVGDTGDKKSNFRPRVLAAIRKLKPNFVFLIGDLEYDLGVANKKGFTDNVAPFLGPWETHCISGNHDSFNTNKSERDFLAANADALGCVFQNYYRTLVFQDACLTIIDSTAWMSWNKNLAIREQQIDFVDRSMTDYRCDGKKKFLMAHHNAVGFANHRNDDKNWKEYAIATISKYGAELINGHEHLIAISGPYHTFGSGSKVRECDYRPEHGFCEGVPGFGWREDGVIHPIFLRD